MLVKNVGRYICSSRHRMYTVYSIAMSPTSNFYNVLAHSYTLPDDPYSFTDEMVRLERSHKPTNGIFVGQERAKYTPIFPWDQTFALRNCFIA